MPSLNVTFTDQEHQLLRQAATRDALSLKAFIHNAALEAVTGRTAMRDALLDDIFAKSAELNKRLA